MPRSVLALILLGAVLRGGVWLLTLQDPSIPAEPDDYLAMGQLLVNEGLFPRPAYPPLYPLLLGLLSAIFGAAAPMIATFLQVLASIATIPAAFSIGRWLEGPPVQAPAGSALLFCGLVACDPLLVLFPSWLLTEAPFVPMLFLLGALLVRVAQGHPRWIVAVGALLGLMLLTRTVASILAVGLGIWALLAALRARDLRLFGWSIAGGSACLALLVPWMLFHQRTHGVFALTSSFDHNVAALYVNAGRCRVEPAFCGAQIRPWLPEGLSPEERPFQTATLAREAALQWAAAHPAPIGIAVARGQALRMFAPGSAMWTELGLGTPALGLSLLWRVLYVPPLLVGLGWSLLRSRASWPILALFALQYLALGPIADARFLVPLLPFTSWFVGVFISHRLWAWPQ